MRTSHVERHFTGSALVRDIVIGMSDGLTVPFALAAGLSGSVAATGLVVTAGFAEIAAGSLAMGLGGYLAAKSDAAHYVSEQAREQSEVRDKPKEEEAEIIEILSAYGVTAEEVAPLISGLRRSPEAWVNFMLRFELGLERPEPRRALRSALTIALAYVVGGLIPLAPYLIAGSVELGLRISVGVTLVALYGFGFIKGRFTGTPPARSGLEALVVGSAAAAAAFALARLIA
jgi:VIT1/CCC1 family predicted Fe2+/Mn2+ transporter